MSTLTASQIADLHARRTAKGAGYAPSLAECLDAAREGRLYDVDTQSAGEDGLTIADDSEGALAEWAASVSPDDTAVPARWTAERVVLRHVRLTPDGGHRAPVLATREQAVRRIEAAVARYRAAGHTGLTYQDETRDGRGPRTECSDIELPPAGTMRTWRARNAAPRLFESPMAEVGSYDRAPGVFHGLSCETYTAATEPGTIPPDMLVTARELAAAECYAADAAGDVEALGRAQARYAEACEGEIDAETEGERAFRAGDGYDVRRGETWCLGWAREQSRHDARVAARTSHEDEDAVEGRHVGCGYADCPHCAETRADDGAGVVAYWRGHSAGAVTYQQRPADADEVAAYEGFVARLPATTARLARLAIDLGGVHGVVVDPRATRAVEAAEAPTLPPGAEELAVAAASAVEDAPDRASADVARACERALSARLRPEDAAAYVRGAAGDVIDCARHAYLSRERRAGRDETAEGIAAAEGSALARVRAILPGYEARA